MSTLPLVILLVGVMLITMLTRVFLPIGQKMEGKTIKQVRLTLRYRMLYHRTSIYMIGTVMVLGGLGGWLSFAFQVVMVLGAFAILGIPIRYTFSSAGVALNNVVIRDWAEFEAVSEERTFIRLRAKQGGRDFKLVLPVDERSEVIKLSQKMLSRTGSEAMPELSEKTAVSRFVGRPAKKPRRA
ncbi:MAG TPA: hypothetical protein VH186_37985 [Chloroflexia bacterium]|nr:hypothetical protein [Chloroflexia bacterium]